MMPNLLHTRGPWKWDGYLLLPVVGDPQNGAVHTILEVESFAQGFVSSDHSKTRSECAANRSLIGASPDLIDAAIAAEAVLARGGWIAGSTDPEAVALYKLRAAIDKATAMEV